MPKLSPESLGEDLVEDGIVDGDVATRTAEGLLVTLTCLNRHGFGAVFMRVTSPVGVPGL